MGKTDAKGEPVQTVTIGGKKVDVPIIFILPEESGSKEIERYLHPKVHIESKKVAPLLAGAGAATGIGVATGAAAGGVAAAGKKIGEGVKNTVGEGIGAVGDAAKLSETLSSESEEKPLEELTHGKLEEVEKLPFPVPKEKREIIPLPQSEIDENDAVYRHATGFGFPQERGVKDSIVAYPEEMPKQKEISHTEAEANKADDDDEDNSSKRFTLDMLRAIADGKVRPSWDKHLIDPKWKGYSDDFKEGGMSQQQAPEEEEETTPYFDLLSPEKPKKKKKKRGNSYKELLSAEKSWEKWLQKQQWYSDDDREEDGGKRSVNTLELIADDWTKREGGKGVPKSRVGGTMRSHGRDHTGRELNRKEPVGEHDRVSELGYARGKEFWDKNPKLDEKTRKEQADNRSYGLTISPENAKLWKSWLQKKQTRIDRKQEWGDKSKIGIGSWEDRPELKPKGKKDKKGKRIPEKGQGEGRLREGAL